MNVELIFSVCSSSLTAIFPLEELCVYVVNALLSLMNILQACGPLKLAYKAAWTRVSLLKNLSSDESTASGFGCSMSDNISESVSDACGKSVVLADALQRSGRKEARENIIDCLLQWTKVDTQLSSPNILRSLVKLWVKVH
jgi:hypothetical protein